MTAPCARPLSLAAATIPLGTPADAVRTAGSCGYQMVGVRPGPGRADSPHAESVRRAAADAGVAVLDVEVVRIGTTPDDEVHRLADFAVAAGAAYLLTVSDDPDRRRTVDGFGRLCERTAGTTLCPVLEFMRFSALTDLAAALSVVREVGQGGVLVDPLHLARSGGTVADVAAEGTDLVPYVQLCDAPAAAPAGGPGALADEARHRRLAPGTGELPLAELLGAVPSVPVSVEVPSDEAWARRSPRTWATHVCRAAEAVIGSLAPNA